MNYLNSPLSPEAYKALVDSFESMYEQLSFLTPAAELASRKRYTVSDADKQFIRMAIQEAEQLESIMPSFTGVDKVRNLLNLADQLQLLENKCEELLAVIRKNRIAAFSEAYMNAATYYSILERADKSGIVKAGPAYERLRDYHLNKKSGGRRSKTETSQPGASLPASPKPAPSTDNSTGSQGSGMN